MNVYQMLRSFGVASTIAACGPSTGVASTSTGNGGARPCSSAAECPAAPPEDECTVPACGVVAPASAARCYLAPAPPGTPCLHDPMKLHQPGTCSSWSPDAGVACVPSGNDGGP